ncbi:ribonuclease P protein component 2 [Palaeococcus sp. (in: euryarchaeotes)]|uniref:ribonuclease P protein component 2 n=1 Tax=Palaeococcus sp. (in: euryarchaeotes) TaxID=2820298 RepID=UPI000F16E197|nr:ribonuclease P protein component 2 [Palaeococcus sp. (in: euryarchaeotes)]MCD6559336.1 ribonuclease P protein component 2 [Palaeococcus sp. (in: euryarchaeotes)]RLF77851.1 MAG: ribonuclease P protein component 2 [Thermococci archaeon]
MSARPKTLPPTLRDKRRYIAFQVVGERKFTSREIKNALWETSLRVLGELGTAEAKPWFIKFDEKSQTGILRCDRRYVERVRFALALISRINDSHAVVKTLGVSGTIKRLKMKFLKEFGWK